jgi:hypothetical protein
MLSELINAIACNNQSRVESYLFDDFKLKSLKENEYFILLRTAIYYNCMDSFVNIINHSLKFEKFNAIHSILVYISKNDIIDWGFYSKILEIINTSNLVEKYNKTCKQGVGNIDSFDTFINELEIWNKIDIDNNNTIQELKNENAQLRIRLSQLNNTLKR